MLVLTRNVVLVLPTSLADRAVGQLEQKPHSKLHYPWFEHSLPDDGMRCQRALLYHSLELS